MKYLRIGLFIVSTIVFTGLVGVERFTAENNIKPEDSATMLSEANDINKISTKEGKILRHFRSSLRSLTNSYTLEQSKIPTPQELDATLDARLKLAGQKLNAEDIYTDGLIGVGEECWKAIPCTLGQQDSNTTCISTSRPGGTKSKIYSNSDPCQFGNAGGSDFWFRGSVKIDTLWAFCIYNKDKTLGSAMELGGFLPHSSFPADEKRWTIYSQDEVYYCGNQYNATPINQFHQTYDDICCLNCLSTQDSVIDSEIVCNDTIFPQDPPVTEFGDFAIGFDFTSGASPYPNGAIYKADMDRGLLTGPYEMVFIANHIYGNICDDFTWEFKGLNEPGANITINNNITINWDRIGVDRRVELCPLTLPFKVDLRASGVRRNGGAVSSYQWYIIDPTGQDRPMPGTILNPNTAITELWIDSPGPKEIAIICAVSESGVDICDPSKGTYEVRGALFGRDTIWIKWNSPVVEYPANINVCFGDDLQLRPIFMVTPESPFGIENYTVTWSPRNLLQTPSSYPPGTNAWEVYDPIVKGITSSTKFTVTVKDKNNPNCIQSDYIDINVVDPVEPRILVARTPICSTRVNPGTGEIDTICDTVWMDCPANFCIEDTLLFKDEGKVDSLNSPKRACAWQWDVFDAIATRILMSGFGPIYKMFIGVEGDYRVRVITTSCVDINQLDRTYRLQPDSLCKDTAWCQIGIMANPDIGAYIVSWDPCKYTVRFGIQNSSGSNLDYKWDWTCDGRIDYTTQSLTVEHNYSQDPTWTPSFNVCVEATLNQTCNGFDQIEVNLSQRILPTIEQIGIPDSCLREVCFRAHVDNDSFNVIDRVDWDFDDNNTIDTSSAVTDTVCHQFYYLSGNEYEVTAYAVDVVPPPARSTFTDPRECPYENGKFGHVGYQLDQLSCDCDSGLIVPPNYMACVRIPSNVTALCDGWASFWHYQNPSCDSSARHNDIGDTIKSFQRGCVLEAYEKAEVNRKVLFPLNDINSSYPEVHHIKTFNRDRLEMLDFSNTVDLQIYYDDYVMQNTVDPKIYRMFYLDQNTCNWKLIIESYADLENKRVIAPEQGVTGEIYTIMGFIPPPKVLDNVGCYPNPFNAGMGPWPNGETKITYTLTENCDINMYIYNAAGGLVREFFFAWSDPAGGTGDPTSIWHEVFWDGYNGEGRVAANGAYLLYVKAKSHVDADVFDAYYMIGVSR